MRTYTFFFGMATMMFIISSSEICVISSSEICVIFLCNIAFGSEATTSHLGPRPPSCIWVRGYQITFGSEATKSHLRTRPPNHMQVRGQKTAFGTEATKSHLGPRPQIALGPRPQNCILRIWDRISACCMVFKQLPAFSKI